MSEEERILAEADAGEDGFGPSPLEAPRGPSQPVAKELIVGSHGAPGVSFIQRLSLRKIGVVLLVAVLVLLGVLSVLPKGTPGEPLALKFEPGQVNRYRALIFFKGTRVPLKGRQQAFNMTMGATVDTKVASVGAEGATVDVTISNFALHTGTPAFDVVPDTIHGQMVVDEDGTVKSGGLGLSAAVASKVIPGWDVLVPILPPGVVVPGATWDSSTDVAFLGSETVHVSADSTLISYVTGGRRRMAVVTSKMSIPVDKTISIVAVADALKVGVEQVGFPEGSDPKFAYKGSIDLDTITRIDTSSGQIFSTYTRGTTTYTQTISDWPSTLPEVLSGEVQTSASFSVLLRQQAPDEPSPEKPGKPEKSGGASGGPSPSEAG